MLTYDLSARGKTPLYEYLYRCLRRDILSGALPSGGKLPGKRALAAHLGVSVITVESAYSQLVAEGCVRAEPRRGYFVAARALAAAEEPPAPRAGDERPEWRLDLCAGRMDAGLFPVGVWGRLTRQVLSEDPGALLRSAPHEGLFELREAIAAYLRGEKGLAARPERIIVGAGAEFLYLLLAQLFSGAAIAVEDPGYPRIRQVYTASGAPCLPVPLDGSGVDMAALRGSGAAALHISPAYQYPTGLVTPMPRRQELLAWARDTGGYIIEDDYVSELGPSPRPLPTLAGIDRDGRVIYMNTFSQTISPGMRAGYLLLPERLCPLWREKLGFYSCAVPSLEQHVLSRFISGGFYERHLARLRRACRERREAFAAALAASPLSGRAEIIPGGAGPRLLLRLKTGEDDAALKERAAGMGLRIAFLGDYAAVPGRAESHVLAVNCAALGGDKLAAAIEALESVLDT